MIRLMVIDRFNINFPFKLCNNLGKKLICNEIAKVDALVLNADNSNGKLLVAISKHIDDTIILVQKLA